MEPILRTIRLATLNYMHSSETWPSAVAKSIHIYTLLKRLSGLRESEETERILKRQQVIAIEDRKL